MDNEMLANRYLLNGDPKRAIALYREAIESKPDVEAARCRLAVAYLQDGRFDEAADQLYSILEDRGEATPDCVASRCRGFVKSTELAAAGDIGDGLCRLVNGEIEDARRLLAGSDLTRYPSVTKLLSRLAELTLSGRSAAATASSSATDFDSSENR
ncbi:MAG: tetratricopeptide repeat protein [Myxococcales bacterium]|nr:MAG: tetratricopeptide repeat protein [Myxococcales bacterium]